MEFLKKTNKQKQQKGERTMQRPSTVLALFCINLLLMCASTVYAQNDIIDKWTVLQRTETIGAVGSSDFNVALDSDAIGGEREQYVEITATADPARRISLLASSGELALNNETDVNGFSINIYDGVGDTGTGNGVGIDNDTTDADPFTPSFSPGLNADLTNTTCGASERGFTFIASGAPEGDVTVTFDVFTTVNDWSTRSITVAQNADLSVIFLDYSGFSIAGGTGVDFANVDAIRIRIDSANPSTDFSFSRPLSNCGVDLGDATNLSFYGGSLYSVDSRVAIPAGISPTRTVGGPSHVLSGPRLGATIDAETDTEAPTNLQNGIGTSDFDDLNGNIPDDNDGITFSSSLNGYQAGDTFTVTADVTNVVDADGAYLCGWIDFSDISTDVGYGFEDGVANEEMVCSSVDSSLSNCTSTGATSTQCTLDFVIPSDFNAVSGTAAGGEDEAFLSRFRLTTDWSSPTDASFNGYASDGEVEDYLISNTVLPVSIHSLDSIYANDGLHVVWETASETRNVGFNIWTEIDGKYIKANKKMIASVSTDALRPQQYEFVIANINEGDITDVTLSTIDIKGKEKIYDSFKVNAIYGDDNSPHLINWDKLNAETNTSMLNQGYSETSVGWQKQSSSLNRAVSDLFVDVLVSEDSMQRVTFEQLLAAGMDLSGVPMNDIALTLKGNAVARAIGYLSDVPNPDVLFANSFSPETATSSLFGPGAYIDFWAVKPELPDSLYVSNYVYRIELNSSLVLNASSKASHSGTALVSHHFTQLNSEEHYYDFASPSEDPWSAKLLMNSDPLYSVTMNVSSQWLQNNPAKMTAYITGLTDLEMDMDHQVQLLLNDQAVNLTNFDGRTGVNISADIPVGLLNVGSNKLDAFLTGNSGAPFDRMLVKNIGLSYELPLIANANRLSMNKQTNVDYFTASGFTDPMLMAYGTNANGELFTLDIQSQSNNEFSVSGLSQPDSSYWVSSLSSFNSPQLTMATAREDLTAQTGDFLLIVHPAFMPANSSETHPLNSFIQAKQGQGWTVRVVNVLDIQKQNGGMPLPSALNQFIKQADSAFAFNHVLLVGGDSYDYHDNLGLGSLSFIPTEYIETEIIRHSPNDQLMMDINNDGIADKAIGRWPVRSMDDLTAIVQKTLDWENNLAGDASVVWIVDQQDNSELTFDAQANRVLSNLAGWNQDLIKYDDMVAANGFSQADLTRQAFFASLNAGKTFASFNGHASPTTWSTTRILRATDVGDLNNSGNATVIFALACYTNYFVSPYTDSLSNRLLNASIDTDGNTIQGDYSGAAGIHGAITLSDYSQNETLSKLVLERQLMGETLGEAIQFARNNVLSEVRKTWTLLGDPTLKTN